MPKESARIPNEGRYVAEPPSGKGPGVLVLHPWWGLTQFMKTVCDRLAALGYVALAPDLYGGATASTIEEADRLSSGIKLPIAEKQVHSALDELRGRTRGDRPLGVIGFSLGAYFGLVLACERGSEVGAVVVYYGTGGADFGKARATFLGHFAETDPYEPASSVLAFEKALHAAGREVSVHTYPGTGHWFFEEDRPDAYDATAARLSWKRTTEFLHRHVR